MRKVTLTLETDANSAEALVARLAQLCPARVDIDGAGRWIPGETRVIDGVTFRSDGRHEFGESQYNVTVQGIAFVSAEQIDGQVAADESTSETL